jgi:hypothetical protein
MQWITALYVSYEGAGVILEAAGEDGEEVRCLVHAQVSVYLLLKQLTHMGIFFPANLSPGLILLNAIVVLLQGPLIPAVPGEVDSKEADPRRDRMGSADPLPLGADPNWRAASNSSM